MKKFVVIALFFFGIDAQAGKWYINPGDEVFVPESDEVIVSPGTEHGQKKCTGVMINGRLSFDHCSTRAYGRF